MKNYSGCIFFYTGIEFIVNNPLNDKCLKWNVSPKGNPSHSQIVPVEFIEKMLNNEKKVSEITLLEKLSKTTYTDSDSITLEVTKEELNFIRLWINIGLTHKDLIKEE